MIKLVIWDLDDTLWRGTLADGDGVDLHEHRAALIRALNRHGVLSSICSKNDAESARQMLVALGLWDEFVFPRIAFAPKGEAIAAIIADMRLRAADVLFVDDNVLNLEEARFRLPDLQTLDIRAPGSDAVLEAILSDQPASRNRVAEYRAMARKQADRSAAAASDEEFLHACEIRACAAGMMTNLDFVDRIVELINRSNQLNYTQSRVDRESLMHDIIDGYLDYLCWSVFAWDKYGDHGLVGFVMVNRHTRQFKHFVFSCRVMHLGLERYVIHAHVDRPLPDAVVPDAWLDRIGQHRAEWITDLPYEDAKTRQLLFASQGKDIACAPELRIMCACQSGGLAHYSAYRQIVDFDMFPRQFTLTDYHSGGPSEALPPFIVYGAGADYREAVWPVDLLPFIEAGLFAQCVYRMCAHLAEGGIQALIFLPPENLAQAHYGWDGVTFSRVVSFNAVWREAAQLYPCLSIVDVDEVCSPEELVDLNHHRPAALQTLSSLIDVWFTHASGAVDERFVDAA